MLLEASSITLALVHIIADFIKIPIASLSTGLCIIKAVIIITEITTVRQRNYVGIIKRRLIMKSLFENIIIRNKRIMASLGMSV